MENISLLLSEALTPYQATLGPVGANGERVVTLRNAAGAIVIERMLCVAQLRDKRQLTDVVDGFHRDLLIAEGRIEPCVIAAMRHATHTQVFTSFQAFN
ncbi:MULTISPECIES: DUF3509 domain-containing protein [unclassified Pseudomonas]|uniref:DUF3509 domain-containing protein n=1 Tax=unclassified Pseudomonas TaxID=196821 RepID=UPI002AC9633A|nr:MULTISPECIES: DUF3509 domain-containing protein [unclassified Pseudomonas]MEB0039553.1 DUF3509 domain-containing protein [Pseudomonas sp. MH10]MEB0077016.1 DUF3509 domain-containing protein [Pseudomonas sp. MH10out]MEB0089818.1 DUF3509 domain-containing protein [Pseudomonas sp. CCI4.2]MEB0102360.1 DUF3509 domain-containing protein [Pseudomonas sp. CCI3.2]MEB0120229.1 DUF3509 domain-containing protein [Pseudomonas sp. CCI1.2]